MKRVKENQDAEMLKTSERHYSNIGMAVECVRNIVPSFDVLPERVVPTFEISEEEIQYLEDCVRNTVRENHLSEEEIMDEGYPAFFEETVRIGLNMMLSDKDHPTMRYYLNKLRGIVEEDYGYVGDDPR